MTVDEQPGELRLRHRYDGSGLPEGLELMHADRVIYVERSVVDQLLTEERDRPFIARGPIRLDGEILSVRLNSGWTIRYRWTRTLPDDNAVWHERIRSMRWTGQLVFQRIAGLPPHGWTLTAALRAMGVA